METKKKEIYNKNLTVKKLTLILSRGICVSSFHIISCGCENEHVQVKGFKKLHA
jgi:hypothetical protein